MLNDHLIWCMAFALIMCACDDDNKKKVPPSDTQSASDTETDTASDTGLETDTGEEEVENETPPQLPERCATGTVAGKLSGDGNGTMPAISNLKNEAIAAFTYDERDTASLPAVQLGFWDMASGEWLNGYPFDDAYMSNNSSIADNGTTLALVWLEGRAEWNPACVPSDGSGANPTCQQDVAFATITTGLVNESIPLRISTSGLAIGTPSVVSTSDGWVVLWGEAATSHQSVWSAHVSSDGVVSAPLQICDVASECRTSSDPRIITASVGDTLLAIWPGYSQGVFYVARLTKAGTLLATPVVLNEEPVYEPSLTASNGEFMISYGMNTLNDAEIFTRRIDSSGQFVGEANRITYTDDPVKESFVTWVDGMGYAVAWLSKKANGSDVCVDSKCKSKVFASILDNTGALAAVPVLVSIGETELNPCLYVTLGGQGFTWIAAYEILRNMRTQILYSTFTCQ
ncbi:MAG: hypothetical protein JXR76_18395 [Deltaproteobacteria bacterium]|nr:hypothetical protein [Deltaproteobacteria bacterium]